MKRFVGMLGLLLLTCLAVRGQSTNSVGTNEFFRVEMTVLDVAELSTYKGPLIPRDPEPNSDHEDFVPASAGLCSVTPP